MPDGTTRRSVLKTTGTAVAAMGALSGCLGGSEAEEGPPPLEIDEIPPSDYGGEMTMWGFYNEWYDVVEPVLESEYDLQVNTNVTTTSAEQIGELEVGNEEQIDVLNTVAYVVTRGLEQEWYQPLPIDRMECYQTLPDTLKDVAQEYYTVDGETYAVPGLYDVNPALVYNSDHFDEPPSTWSVLWDEDLAGDVAIFDNAVWACYLGAMHTGQDPMDPDDFEEIEEALVQQQDLNETYWGDYSQGQQLMSSEQIVATANTAGRAFRSHFDDEATFVEWTIPEEGAILSDGPHVVPVGAANTEAAMVWFEYVLTGEGNFGLFEGYGQSPALEQEEFERIADEKGVPDAQVEFTDIDAHNPLDAPLHATTELDPETQDEYGDIWTRVRGA